MIQVDGQSNSQQIDYEVRVQKQFSQVFFQFIVEKKILIKNAFTQFIQNSSFSLQLNQIQNQNDADTIEQFTISLIDFNQNLCHTGNITYQSLKVNIKNFTIIRSSEIVNNIANYTILIAPYFQLTNQGIILIEIPQQINIKQESICFNTFNMGTNFSCQIQNKTLLISRLFQRDNSFFQFDIQNVQNPTDTIKTDGFSVTVLENNKLISQDLNFLSLLYQPFNLQLYTDIDQNQKTNSQGTIQLTIQNPINWQSNYSLIITPPQQLSIRTQNFTCQVISQNSQNSKCIRNNTSLFITGLQIQFFNLTIKLKNIQLERSLAPTEQFEVEIQNMISETIALGTGGQIQLSQVPILNITMVTNNYLLGKTNTWNLDIFLERVSLQVNDILTIQIPQNMLVNNLQCMQIQPSYQNQQCLFNETLQVIIITIRQIIPLQTKLSFQIQNITNPLSQTSSTKWVMLIQDDSAFLIASGYYQGLEWTKISCNSTQVIQQDECKNCKTNSTTCESCSNQNLSQCIICSFSYNLLNDTCVSLPAINSNETNQGNEQGNYGRSGGFQIIDYNFILTTFFLVILIVSLLQKINYNKTRAITLCYGFYVIIQNCLEMVIVVNFFSSKQLEFGFASLSIVVIHLISQIYSITQTSFTFKIDPCHYTYKRQSLQVKLINLVANSFCYRTIILLFSRASNNPQWDAQWIHRITILDQICVLLRICILYSICFFALILTYIMINKDQKLQLFFFELIAFNLIVLILDVYHLWFVNHQLVTTLILKDSQIVFDPLSRIKDLDLGQNLYQDLSQKQDELIPEESIQFQNLQVQEQ